MSKLNFSEFPKSTYEDWKKLSQKELGEKPFESLIWKNENGFDVPPYFNHTPETIVKPKRTTGDCRIHHDIYELDIPTANKQILKSLEGGADSIGAFTPINNYEDFLALIKAIHIEFIAIHFGGVSNELKLVEYLVRYCRENNIQPKALIGSLGYSAERVAKSASNFLELAQLSKEHFSLLKPFVVRAQYIHEDGGTAVHELAFALSYGNEVLHTLCANGFTIDDASAMLMVEFATGGSYFVEIAKYRAFRFLWWKVVEQYKPDFNCTKHCIIHANTSGYLQTTLDLHNNLLRATTQAMSAILGDVDSVCILGYDSSLREADDTSLRLARNIHHLLNEESFFNDASSAAEGSHYISHLTFNLVEEAWKLFLQIEEKGGIEKCPDLIPDLVEAHKMKREVELEQGKRIVVGVNMYRDEQQVVAGGLDNLRLSSSMEKKFIKEQSFAK
ncbi:MAG: methylmalonyl-CoA mutase family protein [Flavobacteriales bacterium]|nr:methylmalonyl-CoA mutase family protein [Flavobacteriales bacterium]